MFARYTARPEVPVRYVSIFMVLAWTGCKGTKGDTDTGAPVADADTDTDSDSDTDTDADTDTDTNLPAYTHTIIVDGAVSDFVGGEYFKTSTNGDATYFTWDASNFYAGTANPDVLANSHHSFLVYLSDGVSPGTRIGVKFNNQQPVLPFEANTLLKWDADLGEAQGTNALYTWSGTDWIETPSFFGTQGSALAVDTSFKALEMKVPLGIFGADTSRTIRAHACWISTVTAALETEKSYAATPWQSFFDRPDPDYTQYFEFDLNGSQFPGNYNAINGPGATDTGTNPVETGGGTGDTAVPVLGGPWRNFGVAVDGNASEFLPGEEFPTSAGVVSGVDSDFWITWSDTDVYLASRHHDVETGTSKQHLMIYLGNGTAGSTTGVQIGTQTPTLPFQANYAIEWRADNTYDGLWHYTAGAWHEQPYFFSGDPLDGNVLVEEPALQTVEMSLPWTAIGLTSHLMVDQVWVDASAGAEKTYSGSPVGSFTEGAADPNYSLYWDFDMASEKAPAFELPLNSAGVAVGTPAFSDSATVDGDATEYGNDEDFTTSTVGVHAHLTWDATNLYVAYEQPEIAGGSASQWFVMYIGNGSPGTLDGIPIGVQQPTLAFQANYAVTWNADDTTHSLWHFDGAAWTERPNFFGTQGSDWAVSVPKQTFEFSIPLVNLGVSTILETSMAWVDNPIGQTSTEGAVPAASFVDGLDPNYSKYFKFILNTPTLPSSYPPLP
jgi:hypothetical protein